MFCSVHRLYQDGLPIYVHKLQKYRSWSEKDDLSKGQYIHFKGLWSNKYAAVTTRRNQYYSPKHNYAVWASAYLLGVGSNAAEQNHRYIEYKNPHLTDMTLGIQKYIDYEMVVRFDKNWVRIKNLIDKAEADPNANIDKLEWLKLLFKQLQNIYSLSRLQSDIFGHGIIQFDLNDDLSYFLGDFNYKQCIIKKTGMNRSDKDWIIVFLQSHVNDYGELNLTDDLLQKLYHEMKQKYSINVLSKFIHNNYNVANDNMYLFCSVLFHFVFSLSLFDQ